MPEPLFYRSIFLLASNMWTDSFVARHLLNEQDRGGLQAVTFHTLRTYLGPVSRIFSRWRASGFADSKPALLEETHSWFDTHPPTE